jgi:hypothetical protein
LAAILQTVAGNDKWYSQSVPAVVSSRRIPPLDLTLPAAKPTLNSPSTWGPFQEEVSAENTPAMVRFIPSPGAFPAPALMGSADLSCSLRAHYKYR